MNRLARVLGELGVTRGDRVATHLGNSIEQVVAQLAILRAGASWVAINRRLAPAEAEFMLEHSGARVLLYGDDAPPAGSLPGCVDGAYDVSGADTAFERRLAASDAPVEVTLTEQDVARLRYTSGTTGRPKAAVLTHASALTSLRNLLAELHDLAPDDVVAHVAPLTHASEALLAPAFWRGARTVLYPGFDPGELRAAIARERVTTVFLVPTMIAALVDDPASTPAAFASLRTVVYGASPIAPDVLDRALALFGPVLLQIYGMSECPFPITTLRKREHLDAARRRSCGLPTTMNEVRVLDSSGQPVAPGAVGQIAVRGPQMMREYWDDPAATAESVVDSWLRSGDLGFLDEEGFLTVVDRNDDVIITGGFNVYPREVEAVLESHPAVAEAAVAAIPHARWGQGVAAWVVCKPASTVSEQELVELCRSRLAGYKKPVRVSFVRTLPKSPTGKLLRRELRDQSRGGAES